MADGSFPENVNWRAGWAAACRAFEEWAHTVLDQMDQDDVHGDVLKGYKWAAVHAASWREHPERAGRWIGKPGSVDPGADSELRDQPIPAAYLAQAVGAHRPVWVEGNELACAVDGYRWPCSTVSPRPAPRIPDDDTRKLLQAGQPVTEASTDQPVNRTELDWHYGPTDTQPDPGRMWHRVCGGEVWSIDDGLICQRCGQQDDQRTANSDQTGSSAPPTEPRVWRKGDPEPPDTIQVLVDCKDDNLPYLCRIPGTEWWQWLDRPADRLRAPGGVPWDEATAVMGSGKKDYLVSLPQFSEVDSPTGGEP